MICCESLDKQMNNLCKSHGTDCPDTVIVKYRNGFGIPIRDGGSSFYSIKYCPFCGKKLPK